MANFCRLCATQQEVGVLTVIEDENSEICQQLRTICQVDIRLNDPLPKCVCAECVWMLDTVFLFRSKVQKSQDSLNAILVSTPSDRTVEVIKEEHQEWEGDEQEFVDLEHRNGKDTHEADANDGRSKPNMHPLRLPLTQEPPTVLIGNKLSEILKSEIHIDADEKYADVKQEKEFLDLEPDNTDDAFVYNLDTSVTILTATGSPLQSTDKQEVGLKNAFQRYSKLEDQLETEMTIYEELGYSDVHKNNIVVREVNFNLVSDKAGISKSNNSCKSPRMCTKTDKRVQSNSAPITFVCKQCPKVFTSQIALSAHSKKHADCKEEQHKCKICGKTYVRASTLQGHIRIHTGERPYQCTICGCSFTEGAYLKDHMNRHTGKRPYKCAICGSAFTQRDTLHTHMRRHTGERPYKCSICKSTFTQHCNLRRHMKQHIGEEHRKIATRPRNITFLQKTKPSHQKKDSEVVDVRLEKNQTNDAEQMYANLLQKEKKFQYSKSDNANNLIIDKVVNFTNSKDAESRTCTVCGQVMQSKKALQFHIRTYCGIRPFACNQCPRSFQSQTVLLSHMKRHSKTQDIRKELQKCNTCGKEYVNAQELKSHMRVHARTRSYQCSICGSSFTQAAHLKDHIRRHTGERPFKCSICGSAFAQRGTLTSHLKLHSGERPHKCSICDCSFAQKGNLKTHMKQHAAKI